MTGNYAFYISCCVFTLTFFLLIFFCVCKVEEGEVVIDSDFGYEMNYKKIHPLYNIFKTKRLNVKMYKVLVYCFSL